MGSYIIGPYFFDENVNGEEYLRYLRTDFQSFLKTSSNMSVNITFILFRC